jgi:hypothetical protein
MTFIIFGRFMNFWSIMITSDKIETLDEKYFTLLIYSLLALLPLFLGALIYGRTTIKVCSTLITLFIFYYLSICICLFITSSKNSMTFF